MKRIITITCIGVCTIFSLFSQEKVEIRLVPTNVNKSADVLCFDTQFKNISNIDIKLAGQNYRLFYDALQLKFVDNDLTSLLVSKTYDKIDLNQSLHNIDARGYGNLKFAQNLGFLNYSVRMTDNQEEIVTLPAFSPWLSTTNICFQATNSQGSLNIVWAREGLTGGYATAYTEISILDEDKVSSPALIQIYQDFIKLSDGTGVNDPMILQSTQNH
ncbi:MAG: hypothetical protein V3V14_12290 [Saprospiraceae bacterium]